MNQQLITIHQFVPSLVVSEKNLMEGELGYIPAPYLKCNVKADIVSVKNGSPVGEVRDDGRCLAVCFENGFTLCWNKQTNETACVMRVVE